jgi:hypothetical protein
MTIDECIEALQGIKNRYPDPDEAGDIEVVIGVGFREGGKIESLSLQAEPRDDENEIVFEEKFEGRQPESQMAEKIRSVLRRYYGSDPWTGRPCEDPGGARTAQEAVDAIVDILE